MSVMALCDVVVRALAASPAQLVLAGERPKAASPTVVGSRVEQLTRTRGRGK